MSQLILLRHGQSEWNKKNIFTGWVDIPLSEAGIAEALAAGEKISREPIDLIYTSTLVRGSMTAMLAMTRHKSEKIPFMVPQGPKADWAKVYDEQTLKEMIPTIAAWQLNERMYGELQGKNKDKMRAEYGEEQVHIWRRSFDVAPPSGESLKMTAKRAMPYFEQEIVPQLEAGKNILISAHGNSLRSIVMDMESLSEEQVLALEIPTGKPLIYQFNEGRFVRSSK